MTHAAHAAISVSTAFPLLWPATPPGPFLLQSCQTSVIAGHRGAAWPRHSCLPTRGARVPARARVGSGRASASCAASRQPPSVPAVASSTTAARITYWLTGSRTTASHSGGCAPSYGSFFLYLFCIPPLRHISSSLLCVSSPHLHIFAPSSLLSCLQSEMESWQRSLSGGHPGHQPPGADHLRRGHRQRSPVRHAA